VVKNIANHSVSSIKVYVESLDERGTIVGTGWSYLDPITLGPGTTGSFVVYVKGNPQKVNSTGFEQIPIDHQK